MLQRLRHRIRVWERRTRPLRGPRAHAQLIGGEVSLLAPDDHAEMLLIVRRHGREPMSMTHGDIDYSYLEQLVLSAAGTRRLDRVSFAAHFDRMMFGRRGIPRRELLLMTDPSPRPARIASSPSTGTCTDGCCNGTATTHPAAVAPTLGGEQRVALTRRVRLLVAATIAYNVVEAIVALTAGTVASSAALIGFGLDSIIEVASVAAVAWQFSGRDPEARERAALRVIALSFFALAAYVGVESIRALLGSAEAEPSTVGIALAAVSLLVMPFLSHAQRRAGRALGSLSAVADSKQTLLCTYLSAVLLVGLLLNSLFGLSWADPIAALVIAAVAAKEGRDAWRGRHCC